MRHRLALLALTAAGSLGLASSTADRPASPEAAAAPVVADAPVEPPVCELFEGRSVLELVREHRRDAAEPAQRELARTIVDASRGAGVDPLLVASIVASESSFRASAVSRVGAVGLMQIRPFVGRDVARRSDVDWRGTATLESPEANLRLGIAYYRELLARFDGDDELALTAYNQGPTRVRRKLADGRYRGSDYASRILARYGALAAARPANPLAGCADAV